MKLLNLLNLMFALTGTQALAQTYAISGEGSVDLKCNITQPQNPSQAMVDTLKSKQSVLHCASNSGKYEISFIGVQLALNSELITKNTSINLHCTGGNPEGAFIFGGYPIGYTMDRSSKAPWFYNMKKGGRCSLEFNSKIVTEMKAVVNKSAFVLLKI